MIKFDKDSQHTQFNCITQFMLLNFLFPYFLCGFLTVTFNSRKYFFSLSRLLFSITIMQFPNRIIDFWLNHSTRNFLCQFYLVITLYFSKYFSILSKHFSKTYCSSFKKYTKYYFTNKRKLCCFGLFSLRMQLRYLHMFILNYEKCTLKVGKKYIVIFPPYKTV